VACGMAVLWHRGVLWDTVDMWQQVQEHCRCVEPERQPRCRRRWTSGQGQLAPGRYWATEMQRHQERDCSSGSRPSGAACHTTSRCIIALLLGCTSPHSLMKGTRASDNNLGRK
jgi:hypothetical protein